MRENRTINGRLANSEQEQTELDIKAVAMTENVDVTVQMSGNFVKKYKYMTETTMDQTEMKYQLTAMEDEYM